MVIEKRKILFISILLLVGLFVSCSKVNDMRLDKLEKSINNLDQSYKEFTPEKLQKAIELCEKQFDGLDKDGVKLSNAQQLRLSNLKGKYHKTLLKIKIYTLTQNFTDGWSEVIEYVKDVLEDD